MGSALVVGDRGAGLTTFVGLLYAAQLRLGTEERDEFRFSADRETIRQLEGIYGELVAGRFPDWDADWDTHPLSFVFAFRAGTFPRLGGPGVHRGGGFDSFRMRFGGISVESMAELAQHDAILEVSTRQLFESPVVVPLLDASRLRPPDPTTNSRPLEVSDRRLASTFQLLCRYLATGRRRTPQELYPMFVVTKFDQCPPGTLARLLVPPSPPASWASGVREAVGARLLTAYFPHTLRVLENAKGMRGRSIAAPQWFFSGLQLVPGSAGGRIARRSRIPVGGWEPEYPFEEYRTLIHRLGTLAHRFPGEDEGS